MLEAGRCQNGWRYVPFRAWLVGTYAKKKESQELVSPQDMNESGTVLDATTACKEALGGDFDGLVGQDSLVGGRAIFVTWKTRGEMILSCASTEKR